MATYLVHKMNSCRKSLAPPVHMEGASFAELAAELRGDYEGQYTMIELEGAYKKVYRADSAMVLHLL